MSRPDVVTFARELLNTPYVHQGRVAGLQMDCAGVPVHVAKRLGMSFEDVTGYGRLPLPDEMKKALDRSLLRVSLAGLQFGDVVWIRFALQPQHLAIVGDYHAGGFSLIHAYGGAVGKVVEHALDANWRKRIVAAWRFPESDQ